MFASRPVRLALPTPTLALVFLLAPSDAAASQYRAFCISNPNACTYTGPNAPVLRADVCYGSAIGIRLKGAAPCPTGAKPYYVEHGEVINPVTNAVAAYMPLDDACSQPGLCVEGPPPPDAQSFPMCCTGNASGSETCVSGVSCGGTLYYCVDGVCNDDGTVTRFDAIG